MDTPLFKAFVDFAARVASSDDPKLHQKAGQQLQKDLNRLKINGNSVQAQGASRATQRPTDT